MLDSVLNISRSAILLRLEERRRESDKIVNRMSSDFSNRKISYSGLVQMDIGEVCNQEIFKFY